MHFRDRDKSDCGRVEEHGLARPFVGLKPQRSAATASIRARTSGERSESGRFAKSVEGGIPARFRSSNSERIASRLFPVEIQIFQSWPFSWEGALVASSAIA
jgi:hypothetical protein